MKYRSALFASLLLGFAGANAHAADAGDWIWRVGVHSIQPKSDNHEIVDVGSSTMLTFSGTYMLTPNWGVEVLAALPFEHDISLNSGGKVAKTKHLPPTVTAQYQFNPQGTVRPYIGAGLNYTFFFDEKTRGALDGNKLKLDSSFGVSALVGVDVDLGSTWFLNVNARWFDIDTDAKLNGADIGTVEIDPYAIGLSVGRRF
jgi:outer membrane protein